MSSATGNRSRPHRRAAALLALALAACGRAQTRLEDLNVLVLLVDTLGAEHVGYVSGGDCTPNLDRLAREGAAFRRAYAPAPWTQPSLASLYTGQMPSRHGVQRLFDQLAPAHDTLAERMEARGFETAGVTSNELAGARYGFAQGFRHYDESPVGGHDAITSHRVTDAAIRWLAARRGEKPFFLFVHYFDPHYAFQHHAAHDRTSGYRGWLRPGMDVWELLDARERLAPDDVAYLVGLYREEVAYTDAHVGRLLEHLRSSGLERSTLVVLLADHGEEFMRHGWIGHTRTLYDELLHVPLVVRLPGRIAPRVIDEPVSLLDVLPTLMALSEQPDRDAGWEGVSLAPALFEGAALAADRELLAEVSFAPGPKDAPKFAEKTAFKTALLRGPLKLVHDLLADRFALFDRGADPEELRDLWGARPEQDALRERLLAWERERPAGREGAPLVPTDEEAARLRALGYLRE
jgi:arylsulfatase A-like enzyme